MPAPPRPAIRDFPRRSLPLTQHCRDATSAPDRPFPWRKRQPVGYITRLGAPHEPGGARAPRRPRPDRVARGAGSIAARRARADPLRPHGHLAFSVLHRRGDGDGARPRLDADGRAAGTALWRRAPAQLRRVGCVNSIVARIWPVCSEILLTHPTPRPGRGVRYAAASPIAGSDRRFDFDGTPGDLVV
jgi:hypothetical protein